MKALLAALAAVLVLAACGSPNPAVSVTGFRFDNYDYVVVAKPDAASSALYGMDVQLANLMERYGISAIGDKAYNTLTPPEQRRTLIARLAFIHNQKKNLLAVSFDDAVSGKTGLSVSEVAKGDIYDNDDRQEAFVKLSRAIEQALLPEKAALQAKARAKAEAAKASVQPAERIEAPESTRIMPTPVR